MQMVVLVIFFISSANSKQNLTCPIGLTLAISLCLALDCHAPASSGQVNLTRTELEFSSLFCFSRVARHVQLGFFLLPPLIPHERGAILLDRRVIFQKGVGCLWEEECLLLLSEQFSLCFMMYCTDFVEIVCLPHENTKCFVVLLCAQKGHSLLDYTFPKSLFEVESPSLILLI